MPLLSNHILPRYGLLLVLLAVVFSSAAAQDAPVYEVHPDYTARQWTLQDGLPSNAINQIVPTSDGYLWLRTVAGPVRFDGRRFTVFNPTNTPSLQSSSTEQLIEGPPGYLWIVENRTGLVLYHDGRFSRVETEDVPLGYMRIALVEGDTVWVATDEGLARYVDGRMRRYRPELINNTRVNGAVRDPEGRLWVATQEAGLYRIDSNGSVRHFTMDDGLSSMDINSLLVDPEGVVWATPYGRLARPGLPAWEAGVARIVGDRAEPVGQAAGVQRVSLELLEAEGGIWLSINNIGWWRHDPSGALTLLPVSHSSMEPTGPIVGPDEQLWRSESRRSTSTTTGPNGILYRGREQILALQIRITHFSFDDQGTLWVGTDTQGLFRLRRSILRTVSEEEGLPSRDVRLLLEDAQGAFWVGTQGGGIAQLDAALQVIRSAGDGGLPVHPDNVLSLHMDRTGTLWVGEFTWLCRVQGARCEDVDFSLPGLRLSFVRAMHEDAQGRFWIGKDGRGGGVVLGRPEGAAWRWSVPRWEGEVPMNVGVIAETRDGTLLFGTNIAGLFRFPHQRPGWATSKRSRPTTGCPRTRCSASTKTTKAISGSAWPTTASAASIAGDARPSEVANFSASTAVPGSMTTGCGGSLKTTRDASGSTRTRASSGCTAPRSRPILPARVRR